MCGAPVVERAGNPVVAEGEDGGGEKGGVDGAGFADRQRPHRNAARHLNRRQQAVHAFERGAFHRHTENRQWRQRRGHAGQMGGPAGAGDNHLQTTPFGGGTIFAVPLGRAVGRNNPRFISYTEAFQDQPGMSHDRPVRLAAHDYAHKEIGSIHNLCLFLYFDGVLLEKAQTFTITKPCKAMVKGGHGYEKPDIKLLSELQ